MTIPTWDAFALRYATVDRKPGENFIVRDFHDEATTMDYFVWFLRRDGETILVDTGFNAAAATARKRTLLRNPVEALANAGILAEVRETIVTHAHYDHAGNTRLLPAQSRMHLQEREMRYATGPDMRHAFCSHAYDVEDVCDLVRANFAGRIAFHDGDYELRPGITVHRVGGHTRGLQIVRVHTERGWIVLASDASHYLDNLRKRSPFPIVVDVADMLRAYETIERLADSPDHVVAGHDPATMRLYAPAGPDGLEIVSLTQSR